MTWRLCVASAAILGACGDHHDAAPPVVDAPPACTGCRCGQTAPPDGGNLFLEYIHVDNELETAMGLPGRTAARAIAFFENAQTPDNSPFLVPGTCNNLEATHGWPLYVGSPHVDLDVGTLSLTGKNAAGTTLTIATTELRDGADLLGRPHDIFYQRFSPNADDLLQPDSSYDVAMSGMDPIATTAIEDGVFVPHDFEVVSPGVEDNGPLVAGMSFPVTWTPAVSANKRPDEDILSLVWLSDLTGRPSHVCVTLHGSGMFTIPGETVAEYRANAAARGANPDKVILTRQAAMHRLAPLPNGDPLNCRRIDLLGTVSWMQEMDVSPGP